MEMKSMKGQGDGSMSGMTSIPHHGSQDIKDVDDGQPGTHTLDRRRSSFNSKCVQRFAWHGFCFFFLILLYIPLPEFKK